MRCAFNLGRSTLFVALLASNVALVSAVNCAPADDDGTPLIGSDVAGSFVTCTYQGAGPCTYFPVDGSFSSGASTCPPGLAQGDTGIPSATTTPASTPSTTPPPPPPSPPTTTPTTPTTTPEVVTTTSTTVTQPPPITTRAPQTTAPSTTASAASTQASSLGVFTSSSPSIITATTVIIVSALVGLPNFLGIAYADASI